MNENKKVIVGLYSRVSTENQSRFGHNLDEQECRILIFASTEINLHLFN